MKLLAGMHIFPRETLLGNDDFSNVLDYSTVICSYISRGFAFSVLMNKTKWS